MYLSRLNTLIASFPRSNRSLREKARLMGLESLSDAERGLLGIAPDEVVEPRDEVRVESINSRYDKFKFGASKEYQNGWRVQISEEIKGYAEAIGEKWYNLQLNQNEILKRNSLNPEKLKERTIEPETVKANLEEMLRQEGLLSADPTYDPDREGPAKDNLWQVYINPSAKGMAISGSKKVFTLPPKKQTKMGELTVSYGHEPQHIVQHENKSKIPLRLFKVIGAGRAEAFAEGGAMNAQINLSQKLFGLDGSPHPHYIKGMITKIEGGNYLDVVKTFYESEIAPQVQLFKEGRLDKQGFDQEKKRALKIAINRSRRITSGSLAKSGTNFLTHSKDTVYLEQVILAERLRQAGLDFTLDIVGVNLENIIRLMRLGFLNPKSMFKLNQEFATGIWEYQKEEYLL